VFTRSILKDLRRWAAQSTRKPLIMRGARQVGKTTAVEIFAADFDTFVRLDLEKREDARNLSMKMRQCPSEFSQQFPPFG